MNKTCTVERELFQPGRIVISAKASIKLNIDDVIQAIPRHLSGDWGEVNNTDKLANNFAVKNELRIVSAYKDSDGIKFWIITEADRSCTTVMLSGDY